MTLSLIHSLTPTRSLSHSHSLLHYSPPLTRAEVATAFPSPDPQLNSCLCSASRLLPTKSSPDIYELLFQVSSACVSCPFCFGSSLLCVCVLFLGGALRGVPGGRAVNGAEVDCETNFGVRPLQGFLTFCECLRVYLVDRFCSL